jgi:hypothetical protein
MMEAHIELVSRVLDSLERTQVIATTLITLCLPLCSDIVFTLQVAEYFHLLQVFKYEYS